MEPVSLRVPLAAPLTASCVTYPEAAPILSVWCSRFFLTFMSGTRVVTPMDVQAVRDLAVVMGEYADGLVEHMEREDAAVFTTVGGRSR